MDVSGREMISHEEVDPSMQAEHHHRHHHHPKPIMDAGCCAAENHPFSSLARQSSIYSLTLDEFQHALCESGKNFGSMNMDEFLTSIWSAEENQQAASTVTPFKGNSYGNVASLMANAPGSSSGEPSFAKRSIAKQPSLPRQGSLTIPAPLFRKTVDEVWSEIHRNGDSSNNNNDDIQNTENAPRQPTFGEMTLEDFLIKAGVVREHTTKPPTLVASQQQQYGVYQSATDPNVGPAFPSRPVPVGDASAYAGNSQKASAGYPHPPQAAQPTQVCYGGRLGSGGGGGGYGLPGQSMAMVGPVSPVSSDGPGHGGAEGVGNQYVIDMSGLRGRKRIIDGPVEKVVERRQRRMIKNRESAARSRARKQAYTVELEAELNQLKEENTQLKRALAELERKRKQQYLDDMKKKPHTKAQKARERLRTLRRNMSCTL